VKFALDFLKSARNETEARRIAAAWFRSGATYSPQSACRHPSSRSPTKCPAITKRLDASLLLIPLVGFLPAADPRVQETLRAIEDKLLIGGEFVIRYETENSGDDLPAGEGAFLACSFWLVDNYILLGRYAEARTVFERLLARCNDVGLFAEELDPLSGRWGISRKPIVMSA
jgi:GH15 family glucan-1,4-alpha-glucosidase